MVFYYFKFYRDSKKKDFTISQLAQKSHVNIQTVRFYERKGLMPNPPRSQSGYRQYAQDSVARIKIIRDAKRLGFSLREVLELLSLRADPDKPGLQSSRLRI